MLINFVLRKYLFAIILLFISLITSAQTISKDDPVVAEFGKYKITLNEYKIAYLDVIKKPKIFDSKELRGEFLDDMITSRLLAGEAKKLNYDKNELYKYRVEAYKAKCLRDAHYEKVIKPKVKITENDAEEAYMFTQEERKISHLFADTKEKADSIYQLLKNGAKFEDLAKQIFKDSTLANHGGNLGWVYWDQLDYDLAMEAFRLPPNQFSKPVKSSFGYHIIKVTDYKKKPLITRQEYEAHRRKARILLQFKIGDQYAFEYIGEMVKKAKITIYPKVIKFIQDNLENKFNRKPSQLDQMSEFQLNDGEIEKVKTSLWDARKEVMATINGKEYTIGDFIGALNYIPYEVVYSNFKKTVDYAFRDFIISQEALSLGLDKTNFVKQKWNLYSEYLLQLELRKKLVRETAVDEDELHKYYDDHKKEWKDVPYEDMKDYVKEMVLNAKKRNNIPNYVKSLLSGIKVKKNLKIINDYYDNIYKTKG